LPTHSLASPAMIIFASSFQFLFNLFFPLPAADFLFLAIQILLPFCILGIDMLFLCFALLVRRFSLSIFTFSLI